MRTSLAAALGALLLAAPAQAQRQPYGTNDYGGFRSVLPPGTKGVFNATDSPLFQANGTYPAHYDDQLGMYRDLMYATPGPRRGRHRQVLQGRAASASRSARRSAPTARAPA